LKTFLNIFHLAYADSNVIYFEILLKNAVDSCFPEEEELNLENKK